MFLISLHQPEVIYIVRDSGSDHDGAFETRICEFLANVETRDTPEVEDP
jgi:hypothetical protein